MHAGGPAGREIDLHRAAHAVSELLDALGVVARSTPFSSLREHHLLPLAGVALEAEHACMSLCGVRAAGSMTVTSALVGIVRGDERTRAELFSLVGCRP